MNPNLYAGKTPTEFGIPSSNVYVHHAGITDIPKIEGLHKLGDSITLGYYKYTVVGEPAYDKYVTVEITQATPIKPETKGQPRLAKWELDCINEIMHGFDFNRVHKVMCLLKWDWAHIPNSGIPTLEEIKDKAHDLMIQCCKRDYAGSSTCGFVVERVKDDEWMELSFVVSSWCYPYD